MTRKEHIRCKPSREEDEYSYNGYQLSHKRKKSSPTRKFSMTTTNSRCTLQVFMVFKLTQLAVNRKYHYVLHWNKGSKP
ncbi:hypothetical protein Mapa_015981 [Marchantia paleacea]|nr:hypothetical protein Mapa_015981 [Marchantia paleacea]